MFQRDTSWAMECQENTKAYKWTQRRGSATEEVQYTCSFPPVTPLFPQPSTNWIPNTHTGILKSAYWGYVHSGTGLHKPQA